MTHIFFDLDGTLTDPREGIVRSIEHALATLGYPIPEPAALESFIGPPLSATFRRLLDTEDDSIISAAISAYRSRFETLGMFENQVYPGIPEALAALRAKGFALYALTAKPKVYARRILEHFALDSHFVEIHGPDLEDLRYDKQSLLRRALADRNVDGARVAVVGDRGDDVLAARSNGAVAIAVTWGYGTPAELATAAPDHVVTSVEELLRCLESFGKPT
ncbi:MAG: HAD hydrolase-like protein [Candidatus Binatia bacterium]